MQNTHLVRRVAAMLYDGLLVLALLFLATLPFIALRGGEPVEANENLLYRLVLCLIVYGFFVGFWTRSGRTLGMQSWGLRIELEDGSKPDFGAANLRFMTAILSWRPVARSEAQRRPADGRARPRRSSRCDSSACRSRRACCR